MTTADARSEKARAGTGPAPSPMRCSTRAICSIPYRANSRKNQTRWQFGVLGPAGAADTGIGEDDSLSAQVLVDATWPPDVSVVVRFLQLQHRGVEKD